MLFALVVNPILWVLRVVLLLLTCVAVLLGVATFFVGGWFVAGMSCLMFAEYRDFHNGIRTAFRHNRDGSMGEYALDYKAPVGNAPVFLWRDLACEGIQDARQIVVIPRIQNPGKLCPGCSARTRANERRCRHCGFTFDPASEPLRGVA